MSKDDKNTFVSVKDSKGEKFLCPIDAIQNSSSIHIDEIDDCIEEDVIGRYAGNVKIKPSKLKLENLDVSMVVAFLNQLEEERGNSPRTRNARLAAIKAFFRFMEYRVPSALDQARCIHAIPIKKFDEKLVDYLNQKEKGTNQGFKNL